MSKNETIEHLHKRCVDVYKKGNDEKFEKLREMLETHQDIKKFTPHWTLVDNIPFGAVRALFLNLFTINYIDKKVDKQYKKMLENLTLLKVKNTVQAHLRELLASDYLIIDLYAEGWSDDFLTESDVVRDSIIEPIFDKYVENST